MTAKRQPGGQKHSKLLRVAPGSHTTKLHKLFQKIPANEFQLMS